MSSVPAGRTVPPARRPEDRTRVEPAGPALRAVTEPPKLYPGLVAAIRTVWRNRHSRPPTSEVAARGRETGARI